jgi:hypothetical protein
MKKFLLGLLAIVFTTGLAFAQVPSTVPPYNTQNAAVIAQGNRTTSTVYSALQTNLDKTGVLCRLHQNFAGTSSGTPSSTFGIQIYDAVAQTYLQYPVSGAVTSAVDTDVIMHSGAVATSVPTATTVWGIPLGHDWRAFLTVAGTGAPSITSGVSCGYLK